MKYEFNIRPVPEPRMTQRDVWAPSKQVQRYYAYCNELRRQAKKLGYEISIPLSITFIIPMAKSWSKKKKLANNGQKHEQTPDLDNLIKAFKDALCKSDAHVWQYGGMKKIWGEEGKIIVEVINE